MDSKNKVLPSNSRFARLSIPLALGFFGLFLLVLLRKANAFGIMDDAYIFLRYTQNLLSDGQYAWHPNGDPAYGTTSVFFLHWLIPFAFLFDNPALAVWLGSLFAGFAWLVLTYFLLRNRKQVAVGLVLTALLCWTSAESLSTHFTSGMDTAFALAWLTFCLLFLLRFTQNPSLKNALVAGLIGGLSWWARPDLAIFAVGIPLVVRVLGKEENLKKNAAILAGTALGVIGLCCLWGKLFMGSWLPLTFFAKSSGVYGAAITSIYRPLAFIELAKFLVGVWPFLLIIVLGLIGRFWLKKPGPKPLTWGLLAACGVFTAYYALFVVQIMGHFQRFYFPMLPALLLAALIEAEFIAENQRELIDKTGSIRNMILIGFLVFGLGASAIIFVRQQTRGFGRWMDEKRGFVMDAETVYKQSLSDYWAKLDEVSKLPDGLVIAATEVGMPAALNPGKKIIDLAGLNEAQIAQEGFHADVFFQTHRPDLVYLPHPDYAEMLAEMLGNDFFGENYLHFPRESIQCEFGVAVYRKSPYFRELTKIFR